MDEQGRTVQPHLVAISWLVACPGHEAEIQRSHIIRPEGFTIPQAATNIHGISTEYALAVGDDLRSVLEELHTDCLRLQPILAAAHNFAFDFGVLEAEYRHIGLTNPLANLRSICTMKTTTILCRIPRRSGRGFKWPKLQELHIKLFAEPFPQAHQSEADVMALFRCFGELYRSGFYNEQFQLAQEEFCAAPTGRESEGYVFTCNGRTHRECLEKNLFGAASGWPLNVPAGSLCFLFDYEARTLSGLWQATEEVGALDDDAWNGQFPYQLRVEPLLSRVVALPRDRLDFLGSGRIPNPLRGRALDALAERFRGPGPKR
jgi:hypothetical protein